MNIKLYFFTSFLVGIIMGNFLFADKAMLFPQVQAEVSQAVVSGKIMSASANTLALQTNSGVKELAMSADPVIHKNNHQAFVSDLNAGDQATVALNTQGQVSQVEGTTLSSLQWSPETVVSFVTGVLLIAASYLIWKKFKTIQYYAPHHRAGWQAI